VPGEPRTARYTCGGCGYEVEGLWPPDDQDEPEAPVTRQTCWCGHTQDVTWPGYSFRTEAG
jgi:hypothetical protein